MMPLWAFYFIAKCYMHFRGYLHMDFSSSAVLLGFVLLPIENKRMNWARHGIAALAAALSLWHETWLGLGPSSPAAFGHWLAATFDPIEAMVLVGLLALCEFAARRGFKPMTVAVLMTGAVGVYNLGAASQRINRYVDDFYQRESSRRVVLAKPSDASPDFDVVLLQIEGLSWDDLRAAGRLRPALLDRFDLLLTGFNSVSSFSLPAELRLLRAPCGQVSNDELYKPWPKACSLMELLKDRGFKTYSLVNYAVGSDERWKQLRELGDLESPVALDSLTSKMADYREGPVYGDFDALQRWWTMRQASGVRRAVLYYNTITLDGGTHEPGGAAWKQDKKARYLAAVDVLSADLDRFYSLMQSSGRNAVVLLVPEYGRGLDDGGGSRDPLPQYTWVPVGLKLIGGTRELNAPRQIANAQPTSYLAVAQLISDCLKESPFGAGGSDTTLSQKLPETEFLAENASGRAADYRGDLFVFDKEKKWKPLPAKTSQRFDVAKLRS